MVILYVPKNVISRDTLNLDTFIEIVRENHPLIKKANIYDQIGEAYLLKGQGTLDPKILSDFGHKNFNETNYFSLWQSQVKVPTKLPIDFSMGYERNNGTFLNDQNFIPTNGLIYGGININVLRGFIFDEQRFGISYSELLKDKTIIEKEIIVRETLIQSINSYLQWSYAQEEYELMQEYLNLVSDRHLNILQLYFNGDKPAIDTIESTLIINSAEKQRLDSKNKLIKKQQDASLFMWNEYGNPLSINSDIAPENLSDIIDYMQKLVGMIDPNFENDPLLQKLTNEAEILSLEVKLEKENLKPKLDIKYNTLINLGKDELAPTYSLNDFKYGVAFELPIRNRKTKGALRLNNAKISQLGFDKIYYLQKLVTKNQELLGRRNIIKDLLATVETKISNSQLLYSAEQIKFNLGESSVFLINQREIKILEAEVDKIKSLLELGTIENQMLYLKMGQ